MSIQIVRFTTDAEQVPDVERAIKKLFAAVEDAAPTGIEYAAARVGNADFVLTLQLTDANPLLQLQEALEFRGRIAEWAGAPVLPQPVTLLARYSG